MLIPGTIVDRYRVAGLLGRGGMASVYEVKHEVLGTRHALKVLHNAAPRMRERLIREGRMQARLDPAHVVPVTDVLTVSGAPALLMPYVAGCSLAELLRGYQPTPNDVSALCDGIVAGVISAHDAGIVHRDLKPANILLEVKRGTVVVRVADFGLGRGAERGEHETAAGLFLGTPNYASPEQFLDASSVDTRSDLWSFGAILYEMLVGRRPFSGMSVGQKRRAVLDGRYELEPVPTGWRELVSRLLVVDVDQRLATAHVLREHIAAIAPPASLAMGTPIAEFVRRHVEALESDGSVSRGSGGDTGETMAPSGLESMGTFPTIDLASGAAPTLEPHVSIAHNLPVERDAFVGRDADQQALKDLLRDASLVSVVGPGGVGKTRLVLHHASVTLQTWTGGVAFCDLADARTADGVIAAVGKALDVPLVGDDTVHRLGHAIAGRGRCLIVLDNFEQVVEHAASTLGVWLDRAREATFVVTTRALLGLPGERAFEVAPLKPVDSAALFIARAQAAKPTFTPRTEDRAAIDALVTLLDHLPLAIELAAARTRVASPNKLLARMSNRFKLLSSSGGRHDRQSTLRATLDWSWDLLTPWEQSALAQLAVFEGGFDLDAVESVVDVDAFDDAPWAMDVVQALVDKSLVRTLYDDRFSLLVSVHDYAGERLGLGTERTAAEARHGAFYAGLGTPEALDSLARHGGAPRRASRVLDVDNLMAANVRAIARADAEVAVNTALATWVAVMLTVPLAVGVRVLSTTYAMPGLSDAQRARLGATTGWANWSAGQTELAQTQYAEALRMARLCGDTLTQGRVLIHQAFVTEHRGQSDAAKALFMQAVALARKHGHSLNEGRALHGLGNLEQLLGDLTNARIHLDQALSIHRRNGDERSEAKALGFRGNLHFQQGRIADAEDDYRAAYAIYEGVGDRRSSSWVLGNVGVIHAERGELEEAIDTFEAALAVHQDVGDRRTEGVVLCNLGEMYRRLGRRQRARRLIHESLAVNREVGSRQFEAIATACLGSMAREDGDLNVADRLLTEGLQGMRDVKDAWTEADTHVEFARLRIAQQRYDDAREHLSTGLPMLQTVGNLSGQGLLEATRAELELAVGHREAAWAALNQAETLADQAEASEKSDVRKRIEDVGKRLRSASA